MGESRLVELEFTLQCAQLLRWRLLCGEIENEAEERRPLYMPEEVVTEAPVLMRPFDEPRQVGNAGGGG